MDAIDNHEEPFSDDDYDDLEEKRSIIRQSLDEIAADVGTALLEANLTFPIGLTTPSSGRTLITIVTQDDPLDEEWAQASEIVCDAVSKKLGGMRLRSRSQPCTMVNSPISAAEISANTLAFDTRSRGQCD
jgi:hypothetical protein